MRAKGEAKHNFLLIIGAEREKGETIKAPESQSSLHDAISNKFRKSWKLAPKPEKLFSVFPLLVKPLEAIHRVKCKTEKFLEEIVSDTRSYFCVIARFASEKTKPARIARSSLRDLKEVFALQRLERQKFPSQLFHFLLRALTCHASDDRKVIEWGNVRTSGWCKWNE